MAKQYDKAIAIFPTEYFSREVASDYAGEVSAFENNSNWMPLCFDSEKWFEHGKLRIYGEVPKNDASDLYPLLIYRGYMMRPEQYRRFYDAVHDALGLYPVNTPEEYELMHVLPNVYPKTEGDTARILTYPEGTPVNLAEIKKSFSKFMVKDYVKSVKGGDFPAWFDGTVTQDEFDREMEKFYRYRGDNFTGGICIKEHMPLKDYGGHTNEHRVFYFYHWALAVIPNSGQPNDAHAPPDELIEKYAGLGSMFFIVDYAELDDGTWKILETGDGQVSGLPDGFSPQKFYKKIWDINSLITNKDSAFQWLMHGDDAHYDGFKRRVRWKL
ncbi:MAG: ATP-grasp domain-containing protein [Selenomonadaceae bacterium]